VSPYGIGGSPASSDAVFASDGILLVTTPVRAPTANTIAERVVRTVCAEGPDRLLIMNRRHARARASRLPPASAAADATITAVSTD